MNSHVMTPSKQQVLLICHQDGKRQREEVISPAQSAAMGVLTFAKVFESNLALDYPSCFVGKENSSTMDLYRALNIHASPMRSAYVARGLHYEQERRVSYVDQCMKRDCETYRTYPPRCFVPYQVPQSKEVIDLDASDHAMPRLDRREIWALLTLSERKEIFHIHYEAEHSLRCAKLRSLMESNWLEATLSLLETGMAAHKHNQRFNKRRSAIDGFMANARANLKNTYFSTTQVTTIQRELFEEMIEGVDLRELFQEFKPETETESVSD